MKKTVLSILTITAFCFSVNAQNVNIPDANFKAYLVGNTAINTNADNEIQVSEATAFAGAIQPSANSVNNVTGIEAFANITQLIVQNQPNLISIDVSQNTNLTLMYIDNNNLSSLDISSNTALEVLLCNDNNLSSLELSNNISLTSLFCGGNNITTLDVSSNPNLTQVACDSNNLTELNLKNISTTAFLNAKGNPNLTCIEVDDVATATSSWTNIDGTASFSLSCGSVGFEEQVEDINLSIYPNPATNQININTEVKIESITIIDFTGKTLKTIEQTDNKISVINLTKGAYFLQAQTNEGLVSKKFIIE